ncbi:MAG: hypothetical protein WC505_03335 [Patescibacteria group bacterium]
MSKDKRKKKKYLQGMEHLRPSTEHIKSAQSVDFTGSSAISEHQIIKKDLIITLLIISFLILCLISLFIVDQSGNILTNISEKITSLVIK